MKSPYTKELDPLQFRDIPPEEEKLITMGYEFLGWHNNWTMNPDRYTNCVDHAHNYYSAFPNAWHSKQHTPSGSDVTQWCTKCKIYWKVDMS